MYKFDYGANSVNFRINSHALVPTPMSSAVGQIAIGIHNNIGISPDAIAQKAWDDWVMTVYTSMSAMANKNAAYTIDQVSAYLQFCSLMDIIVEEAKRDLTMVHFADGFSANPLADYWGSGYQSIVRSAVDEGPKWWSRWNTLAKTLADQFPHLTIPYFDQVRYLVSAPFQDSSSGRWNYLYLHFANRTFGTGAPDPVAGLSYGESLLADFMQQINGQQETGFSVNKLAQIKADLLNAYGSKLDHDYGVVIDFQTRPKSVYDGDLIAMINNAVQPPDTYVTSSSGDSYGGAWEHVLDVSSAALAATFVTGFSDLLVAAPYFSFSAGNPNFGATLVDTYTRLLTAPVTLYGPQFDGSAGLYNTSLVEGWTANLDDQNVVRVMPTSHFGVVLGDWYFNYLSTTNIYSLGNLSSGVILSTSNAIFSSSRLTTALRSIRAFNLFDFGNYTFWRTYGTQVTYSTVAEPVDEFAIISRDSLSTYTTSGIFGLFQDIPTKFRTTRSASYASRDNKAIVSDDSSRNADKRYDRKGGRHGKSRKKAE